MKFGWDKKIKVQMIQPDKRVLTAETTPKFVVNKPYGFRQEDIIRSLCEVVSELIEESEARASSMTNLQDILGDKDAIKEEVEVSEVEEDNGQRDFNSENVIYNTHQT